MENTPQCEGQWQDGTSTATTSVQVKRLHNLVVMTFGDGSVVRHKMADVKISAPMSGLPLRLTFSDGTMLTVPDGPVAKALARGNRSAWPSLVESHFLKMSALLLLGTVGSVWFLGEFVVPAISSFIGQRLPASAANDIGDTYFQQISVNIKFEEDTRQTRLIEDLGSATLEAVDASDEFNYRFLVADDIGQANAFALPNGHIIFTDKVFDLLNDDELFAVLAHEVGHVELRHSMKSLVNFTTWYLLASLIFNDYGFVLAPAVLGRQSYSRTQELEADCFAAQALHATGRDVTEIVNALNKITNRKIDNDKNERLKEEIEVMERERRGSEQDSDRAKSETAEKKESDDESSDFRDKLIEWLSTHPSNENRERLLAECDLG